MIRFYLDFQIYFEAYVFYKKKTTLNLLHLIKNIIINKK